MKTKLYFTIIIVLLIMFAQHIIAQNTYLEIIKTDNSLKKIELSILNKLTFTSSDLILNYSAGEDESVPKSEIRKIVFGTTTGVQKTFNGNFQALPNPAKNFIILMNLPEGAYNVSIYSITGSQIFSTKTTSILNSIDISTLKTGIYIIKANNYVTKFTKE
jgi:hypothetical protein